MSFEPGDRASTTSSVPDLPTVAESGYRAYEAITWVGLVVPAATPREVAGTLQQEISGILRSADMKERLAAMGAAAGGGSAEQFEDFMRAEAQKWSRVVRAADLKAQ